MTPTEFLYAFIEQLQKVEGEKPPEVLEYISKFQKIADGDDEEAKVKAMEFLQELSQKALEQAAQQLEQKVVLPLPPDPNYPIGKRVNPRWARIQQIFAVVRQEYQGYKQQAQTGVKFGAIFLLVLWVISLLFSWDTTGIKLVHQAITDSESNVLKFFRLDYVFIGLMYYRWALIVLVAVVLWVIFGGDNTKSARGWYNIIGVELIIFLTIFRVVLIFFRFLETSQEDIQYIDGNPVITLVGIVTFLGWCAVWSLVINYIFYRAKVGDEAKLYFATFGIELIINTVRLYILFIVLYVPIFIGAVFYVSSQGGTLDKSYADLPFEVAKFWGWWIPAILGSINLAMSLGIFFGWNAPVSGIKLSFDSRDMTSEEKDFMIGFYRRLVEAGRGDEQVFKSWNVIESSGVFAFTYGANIFISRGSFTERYFNALVAHEIGHLHQRDGLILQALHSFTYPLFNHLLFNPTTIQKGVIEQDKDFSKPNSLLSGIISSMTITFFTLIFGGWSVQALARFWSKFYINRDYMADDYAVSLGFAGELLNYLDSYKDFDTALPLFNRWRGYTRVRIERIRVKIEMSY